MNPLLVSLLEQYSVQVQELMDLLEAKRITPAVWRDRMGDLLARYHVAALMVGMGQTAVPTEGIALLAGNIANQFGYLDNFATEVAAAEAFRAVWRSRAQMYVNSAGAEFWEGYVYRQAGRFLPLPAMPKDGTTQCLSNCKCSWDIQVLDAEAGDYDATWVMHPAEHCQTCIERAAQWAPLQIRDGMLMETAVKHLPGQHDQMTHGGGGSLGRFENWAAENMTSSQISHVRNGLSAMTDEQREEFFTDAMTNMRDYSSHDALREFMLKRTANVGEDSGEERIGTLNGTAVMRVNGKFSQMPAKGDGIVVGVSGYGDRGTVAYGSASDGHSRIVSMLNGSLDNYVRMIWEGGSIYINSATAGAVDRDRAFRNIYRALDMLHAKGIPANTPVSIWDAFEGNKYIETTVKEFRALEKAKRLKHLPGQHDQMTHGRGVGRVPEGSEGSWATDKAAQGFIRGEYKTKENSFNGQEEFADIQDVKSLKHSAVSGLENDTDMTYDEANGFIRGWADTANDTDYQALSVQKAAADEFGAELSPWQQAKFDLVTQGRKFNRESSNLSIYERISRSPMSEESILQRHRKGLRAMYNRTQEEFKKAGISEVTIYRGVFSERKVQNGDVLSIKGNALESWTSSFLTAKSFTHGHGYVTKMRIPVSRILSTPRTGFGCADEWEYVVIGGADGDMSLVVDWK